MDLRAHVAHAHFRIISAADIEFTSVPELFAYTENEVLRVMAQRSRVQNIKEGLIGIKLATKRDL